ncbi:MAG: GAF domain-containing sensor histidine kinase [Fimbriimonadales bacterium]
MADQANPLVAAVHLATKELSSSQSVEETLMEVLRLCVQASNAFGGTIYIHDPARRKLVFRHVIPQEVAEQIQMKTLDDTEGVAGKAFHERTSIITRHDAEVIGGPQAEVEEATSVRITNMATVPLMIPDMPTIGVVQLVNKKDGEFTETDVQVLETVCSVSALAYLNSVLTEQANRAASLIGMGRVAHDIGNLASALFYDLKFLEPMVSGLAQTDGLSSEAKEYADNLEAAVGDLQDSVDTIVSYSRLISNISAGQTISANMKRKRMGDVVANAASFLETQARSNAVALRYEIEGSGIESVFDPLFVMRIVQNLTGNAIRAVREGVPKEWLPQLGTGEAPAVVGEVAVKYYLKDNEHVIEVSDTGPGMSEETVRQVLTGTAVSRWTASQGSGWGTKIVKELAAAHGGRIEVVSKPGEGTTFRVIMPCEQAEREVGAES